MDAVIIDQDVVTTKVVKTDPLDQIYTRHVASAHNIVFFSNDVIAR